MCMYKIQILKSVVSTQVSIYVSIYRRLAWPVLVQRSSEFSVATPVPPLSPSPGWHKLTLEQLDLSWLLCSVLTTKFLSFFVIDFLSLFLECGWRVFAPVTRTASLIIKNKLELFKYLGLNV